MFITKINFILDDIHGQSIKVIFCTR